MIEEKLHVVEEAAPEKFHDLPTAFTLHASRTRTEGYRHAACLSKTSKHPLLISRLSLVMIIKLSSVDLLRIERR